MIRKFIFIAAALSLCGNVGFAQLGDSSGGSSGTSDEQVGTLGPQTPAALGTMPLLAVPETALGWQVQVRSAHAHGLLVMLFGVKLGPSVLDLGDYGSVDLGIVDPAYPILLGSAKADGSFDLDVPLFPSLPAALQDLRIPLQVISIAYSVALDGSGQPVYEVDLRATNAIEFVLRAKSYT